MMWNDLEVRLREKMLDAESCELYSTSYMLCMSFHRMRKRGYISLSLYIHILALTGCIKVTDTGEENWEQR